MHCSINKGTEAVMNLVISNPIGNGLRKDACHYEFNKQQILQIGIMPPLPSPLPSNPPPPPKTPVWMANAC